MPYKDKEIRRIKQREYQKKHYENNKKYYFDKSILHKKRSIEWLTSYKQSQRCVNCGESHISCLDFHHKDPKNKDGGVVRMAHTGTGIARLKKEILKCDILCSNCHRKLHWEEKKMAGSD